MPWSPWSAQGMSEGVHSLDLHSPPILTLDYLVSLGYDLSSSIAC